MDFSAPDYQAYLSFLSPYVHPFLEQLLDWDHGGVDVDLNEIADHMLNWEDRLSAHLGLTHIDISHIKKIYLYQPQLQRQDALKRWRNRCGLHATYGNLLKLCVEAGHTECARVICNILNRKVSFPPTSSEGMEDQVARHKDVREFSEDLNSGDLYRYLLFKNVPKRDCDIIKEREISGLSFLKLSIKYWESCGISQPGVIIIVKLQEMIKATQATIISNLSPHVIVNAAPDYQTYLSFLSPRVHPLLEKQLDWDHGGVDVDLNEIADHMLDWEDRLSAHLGLTRIGISHIKEIHLHQPQLQRREALKRWRNRCGFRATYGNLLKLCVEAGHTECAQVICDILKRKVSSPLTASEYQVARRKDNLNYLDAYRKILAAGDSLEILFVKIAFLGPPRLGKTTARRRLTGEIVDISSAAEPEQPSTGAVESGGNVVVRSISNTTALMTPSEWSIVKDLTEEAHMLLQFIYNRNMELNQSHVPSSEASSKEIHAADKDEKFSSSGEKEKEHSDKVVGEVSNAQISSDEDSTSSSLKGQRGSDKPHGITEIPKLFRNAAVNPKLWKDIKLLFRDSALLKMEDTGGQPEFMDMLPALTIGPALYLLFCKLIDDLLSRYTVSYVSPSLGESATPVESTYTVEEVLLTALASVSCFSSYSAISEVGVEEAHSSEVKEILTSSFKSVAYIVGTYKDLVSEEQIEVFDQQLQRSIRSTDFFREDLVQFSSEQRMILAIDNMNGGAEEIEKVRKFLERGIHQHFKKLRIPASWLVFSLCLRARTERIASLDDCYQLAQQLNMPLEEIKIALWFLHHYAGVLMYFPDLPELENTVICDTQIIYDSVTNLIINTFKFGSVGKCASERFRETGQFSLEDISGATSNDSGDYIPLIQLVKLLEHLNIIAIVNDNSHPFQTKPIQSSKVIYFMPCVLQNATSEELDIYSSCNPCLPASLMIRYKCGFVPLGIFPAVIANLVGHSPLTLIEGNIKKNRVQFHYGTTDYDKVTLIYRTKYFEIHIRRERNVVTPTHEVCRAVREILESTLKAVSSRMNYAFSLCYQLSFECPSHPGEDHLCVVDNTEGIPHKMKCVKNGKNPQPVDMQSQHLVWFGKALTGSDGCTSASNLQPKGDSNLTTLNIKTILVDEDFSANKARELGIFLGIKKGRINALRINNSGNADQLLTAIIEEWLRNDKKKSWEKLADAVRRCHYPLLADKILEQYCEEVFQKQQQQQQSSIQTAPDEKRELTRESNKRKVVSNGSDKEEVLLGKDFIAEKNKGLSKTGNAPSHDSDAPRSKHPKLSPAADSAGLSRTHDAPSPYSDAPRPKLPKLSSAADSADVREFSEDLSSEDLYRYLLLKHVPKRDCDIIKEKEISGLCFLSLSKEDWKDYKLSRAGVVCVTRLQEMVKAARIEASTSPHVSGETIESALFVASQDGQVEEAKSLLERNAQINFQTNDGTSALHIASQNGHLDVAKLLLGKGAKVDLLNNDQCSPLMIACEHESTDVAQVLLDHDADTYLRNKNGQTALEIAKEKNHVNIISLFAELKEKAAYPGILFSEGVKKESITSDKKIINLEEVGVSLTFPENSLASNEPPVEVAIQPCFSGPFIMPDGIESMSPAYVIKLNRKVTFLKDVVLKIRHYANLQTKEDYEDMVFLSANSTPEYRGSNYVYVFKEIEKAKTLFRPGQDQPVGEILLKHFCIPIFGKRKRKNRGNEEGIKRHKALYSARLFRKEKSAVFCMCLYHPLYMQHCENVIASIYFLKDPKQGLIEHNAVTLSSYDEVSINISDNDDWTIDFLKTPKLSRDEIETQVSYHNKFKELLKLNFPPRIDISVTLTPVTPNPKPLKLHVEGLNSEYNFKLLPGDFIAEVNTTPMSHAIKELHEELVTESESCNSTIFTEATTMMEQMGIVESLIRIQNPTTAITTSVIQTLERMEGTCKQLRNAAKQELQQLRVTYYMEKYIEAVDTQTTQLRVIYRANIKHIISGNAQAATQLFITNSVNLMNSIKELIKSSKLARTFLLNQLPETPPPTNADHYVTERHAISPPVLLHSSMTTQDVREFSEDLSSEDLCKYLLFKKVPKRDCDIIKEREISGLSFLDLSIKYWESCGISEPGVIAIVKLHEIIKATQTTIIPNLSPHVPVECHTGVSRVTPSSNVSTVGDITAHSIDHTSLKSPPTESNTTPPASTGLSRTHDAPSPDSDAPRPKCPPVADAEFEEEKTHGKLSLKQSDRLQVKISSNESEYPDGDSGGEFDGNSDKHYPVCGAAFGLKSELQAGGGTPKSSLASYIPKNTLWKGKNRKKKEKLLVFFFDCKESVLKEWRYNKNPMSPRIVISIIKEHWNDRFAQVKNGDEVPRFEYVDNADDADVRVEFRSEGESWSALGSEAESVSKDKPTMILSFHDKKDDHQICATIVHEFGHVLGLGHEHQHPDYWKVIKNFVNTESMRKSLKLNKVDFNEQWANTTSRSPDIPYDEDSVMHYPTRLEWLREEKYKSRASITKLRDDKELKDEEYKMLSGFLQHVNFIAAEPSKLDVETVVNAYTEENNKHAGSTSKTSKKYLSKDDMPSICHLILLKWKDKEGSDQKLKLVDKICSKWRRMGNLLKIEHGVLDSIWNKNLADGVKCCNEVLEIWLQQGGGNYPVNWNGLCQLLEDLEFLVAAKKLQEAFGKEILN